MELESYFDFSHGEIRIQGTRVYLDNVVRYYNEGMRAEDITRVLRTLSLEEIYVSITYYLANKDAIDQFIEEKDRETEEKIREHERNLTPQQLRLRAKLEAARQEMARQKEERNTAKVGTTS
jgi:uncharacterized protein (DUF433 family)